MDPLDRLKAAFDRSDITVEHDDETQTTNLVVPSGGLSLSDPVNVVAAFLEDEIEPLSNFLDSSEMGLHQAENSKNAQSDGLFLTSLTYQVKEDAKTVTMDVAWHTLGWDVIPKILRLGEPAAALAVSKYNDDTFSIGATVSGQAAFFDSITLNLLATKVWREHNAPPVMLSAHLPEGDEISLDQLLSLVGLTGLPGTSAIAINELELVGVPVDHALNVGFSLAHPWAPGWGNGGFVLNDAFFSISITPVQTSGQIRAMTTLFGANVDITIDHTGGDWGFGLFVDLHGKTFGSIIDELGGLFGLGHMGDVLGPFHDLGVNTIEASASLASRAMDFTITSGSEWPIKWCGGLTLKELHFDVSHGGTANGQTKIEVGGALQFGTHKMVLEASHQGRGKGLDFKGTFEDLAENPLTLDHIHFPHGLGMENVKFPIDKAALSLTKFEVHFNTHSKEFSLAFGGHLADLAMDIAFDISLTPSAGGGYDKHFGGSVTLGAHPAIGGTIDAVPADGAMTKKPDAPNTAKKVPKTEVHPKPGDPGMTFDLVFDTQVDPEDPKKLAKNFIATYRNPTGKMTSLKPVLDTLTNTSDGPDVRFVIHEAVLAASKPDSETPFGYLLSMTIDAGADLSKLPLVSSVVPDGTRIGLGFKPSYTTRPMKPKELGTLNNLLPEGVTHFDALVPRDEGFDISTLVTVGDFEIELEQPMTMAAKLAVAQIPPEKADDANFDVTPKGPAPDKGPVKWIKIQKSIGPLHLSQLGIGLNLKEVDGKPGQPKKKTMEAIAVVDASIGSKSLVLGAMGLGAKYDFSTKKLSPTLDGLALSYAKGATAVTGAFLRIQDGEYAGAAMLRTSKFGLSALGAYSNRDHMKSLFVYAVLDYPLGGPPSFFVEGVAAGFGYNRRIRDISAAEVRQFPFVKEAVNSSNQAPAPPKTLAETQEALVEEMRALDSWVHPSSGEYFLALGLKFNSYKIIDSFALAIFTFGEYYKVEILGTSTLVLPPAPPGMTKKQKSAEPKLANFDISLKATFDPQESLLGIDAVLDDTSWILSKKVTLTGWAAFYSWYDGPHGGDFVTTLGGYHPQFKPPKHYPRVPRVKIQWHVSDNVEIKGTTYFALTPNAMMAGGHLKATWRCGPLHASFGVGAEFLMRWKPFHYEGTVPVEMSAGVGGLTGSISATLDLYGPEFAGRATVKFLFVSYSLEFGGDKPELKAIPWSEFRTSFLPTDETALVATTPTEGVIRTVPASKKEETPLWFIVNPKELRIETSSLVPATDLKWHHFANKSAQAPRVDGLVKTFGIAPMDMKAVTSATMNVRIRYDSDGTIDTGKDGIEFRFRLTGRQLPYAGAMWGTQGMAADVSGDTISHILGGSEIKALKPVVSGQTTSIPRRNVKFDSYFVQETLMHDAKAKEILPNESLAKDIPVMLASEDLSAVQNKNDIAARLSTKLAHEKRQKLAAFLNIKLPKATPSVTHALGQELTFAPRSTAHVEAAQ